MTRTARHRIFLTWGTLGAFMAVIAVGYAEQRHDDAASASRHAVRQTDQLAPTEPSIAALTKAHPESSHSGWWTADHLQTKCVDDLSPATLIKDAQAAQEAVGTQDFHDGYGLISVVDVSTPTTSTIRFYRSELACVTEQIRPALDAEQQLDELADKYR